MRGRERYERKKKQRRLEKTVVEGKKKKVKDNRY